MPLEAFHHYLNELTYAEVYFSASGNKPVCHFNHYRSLQQYSGSYGRLSLAVWHELSRLPSLSDYQNFIRIKLQETGKMFLGESGKPVSHRHILIYHNNLPVLAEELTPPLRHLLSAYLNIQCSAWQELCKICEQFLSAYPGYYQWQGKMVDLLELGDAIWSTGQVAQLTNEKTKTRFFNCLLGFFNIAMPSQLYRSLGEIGKKSQLTPFLLRLLREYSAYRTKQEG